MSLDLYQVDAFTDHAFGGNPAGVCLLDSWLSDDVLQLVEEKPERVGYLMKSKSRVAPR
jgi:predicted PhzF superfamily epimerase YddE/YHI9